MKIKNFPLFIFLIFWGITPTVFSKPYKGAELRTNASYLYGRFEVRMRSAPVSGMLASFFTYHDTYNIPSQWNEIDIENLGRYTDRTQFNAITPNQVHHVHTEMLRFNPHQAFHVYAFEWTPDYIAWFVDGLEVYRQTGEHVQQLVHPQKIMMNIWPPTNTNWAGTLNPSNLPAYAYYDWVRYSAYTPGVGDNFTLQWEDNFDTWDTGRWSKATHTWAGNNSDFVPENAVFYNGYLILCLTTEYNLGYHGGPVVDEDVDAPYIGWARAYPNKVKVLFSEPLDPVSSQTASNYQIPGASVTGASLQPDGRTVILQTPGIDLTTYHTLIAFQIGDLAQPPNVRDYEFAAVLPPVALPAGVNVGGPAWSGYLADQVWYDSLEYGRIGGSPFENSPTLPIGGTDLDELYRTEVRGISFYRIRLDDGHYDLQLRFAETEFNAPGLRVFRVYAEGQERIPQLDIFAVAGANTAYDVFLPDIEVNDGVLELYFEPVVGEPVLQGLEIQRNPTVINQNQRLNVQADWGVYPNPFNQATTVWFEMERPGEVSVAIYDLQGRRLWEQKSYFTSQGKHQIPLALSQAPSGVYLLNLKLPGRPVQVRKILLIK